MAFKSQVRKNVFFIHLISLVWALVFDWSNFDSNGYYLFRITKMYRIRILPTWNLTWNDSRLSYNRIRSHKAWARHIRLDGEAYVVECGFIERSRRW